MFDKYFETYQVGERWTSRGRTITESDLVLFSAFSGDWYPLHTDKEWASHSIFGQRIAHGMLVMSVATGLIRMDPGVIIAFYGIDQVRFVAPTFIGDTIHVELEIVELKDNQHGGLITAQSRTCKQTGEPVVVSTMRVLVNQKPEGTS